MAGKLMYIHNDDPQNYPLCRLQLELKRLDTQVNKPPNQNVMEVPKIVKPINKKTLLQNFGLV